jgi:CYTH domain-containing protein
LDSTVALVHDPLKYAVVERERRFLVAEMPDGVVATMQIVDHYLNESRLRLREMIDADGSVVRKLGHKIRLTPGPDEIACTSIYLDDAEWGLLRQLPARTLRKTRHIVERDGLRIAVDELADGTLLAEVDDGDYPPPALPDWLGVLAEVTAEERWTGASMAR